MKISTIPANELDKDLIEKWRNIQSINKNLRSPYYCPEYTQLVDESLRKKGDTEQSTIDVAILESSSSHEIVGFFPFQRGAWGQIFHVGRELTDYQGIICSDHVSDLDASKFLSMIDGRYFAFNHLPLTAAVFSPAVKIKHQSPVLQTEGGFDAYLERLNIAQGTTNPGIHREVRKRSNKIEREIGPLRFEMHEQSAEALQILMQLKINQWKAGASPSAVTAFEVPWINHFMRSLFDRNQNGSDSTSFRCTLSTLYAGDKFLASMLCLRHSETLHGWFTAYDPQYAHYGCGNVLLRFITKQFADDGIGLIDLGRGTVHYKMRVCTDVIPLGEGACSTPAFLAKGVVAARRAVRSVRGKLNAVMSSGNKGA